MSGLEEVTQVLDGKHWCLEVARKPRLITSDTPVVLWRRPIADDRYRGFGVDNAEEIRFPMDAGHQLVLTNVPQPATMRVEPNRVRVCNADLAAGCHKFIAGQPSGSTWHPATRWDRTDENVTSVTSCTYGCRVARRPPPRGRTGVAPND